MIKRPLVWMLGAYLSGLILGGQPVGAGTAVVLCLLGYLFLFFFWSKMVFYSPWHRYVLQKKHGWLAKHADVSYEKSYGQDRFLWLLPLLLLLGYGVMRENLRLPELSHAFEQQTACELKGRIKRLVRKQNSLALYVEENHISLPEGSLTKGGDYDCENIIVYVSDGQSYRVGNGITVQGVLKKFSKASNPGQFNEEEYYQMENIDFKLMAEEVIITDPGYSRYHTFLDKMKERLIRSYREILGEREAGTLIAMLLGEKFLLEDEIKQLYQVNGISHILVISGLHISFIGMGAFWLFCKCGLPRAPGVFLTLITVYSYGELTNFGVSTLRAVIMTAVMLMAPLLGRSYDMLSGVAFSALLILLENPLQLQSAGFLLSYSAVIGIAIILPELRHLFPGKNPVRDGLLVSFSAMFATAPSLLWFFGQFPVYGIVTNLLILPFVTVLTLTSFLAGVLGILSQSLGVFAAGGAYYILRLYEVICITISRLPGNLLIAGRPEIWCVALSVLLMLLFVWAGRKYGKKHVLLLLAAALLVLFFKMPQAGLEISLLDVGQGDGIFMKSRGGTTYLIDGGSSDVEKLGTYRILPFLNIRGIGRLDYIIVTHGDRDHISGVSEMIEQELVKIGCLTLPFIEKKEEEYLQLEALAREKGIPVRYMSAGDGIKDGNLNIYCLHPAPDFAVTSSNSYSLVLSVNYGEFDMLFTGDLEGEGEDLLVKRLKQDFYRKEWGLAPATEYEVLNKRVTKLIQFRFLCSSL